MICHGLHTRDLTVRLLSEVLQEPLGLTLNVALEVKDLEIVY